MMKLDSTNTCEGEQMSTDFTSGGIGFLPVFLFVLLPAVFFIVFTRVALLSV